MYKDNLNITIFFPDENLSTSITYEFSYFGLALNFNLVGTKALQRYLWTKCIRAIIFDARCTNPSKA